MSDVVIRGMEMPKVCIDNGWYGNCPMDRSWCARRFAPKDSTNESAHKDQWNKLPSWCPLVPLPEGHGRLVDAREVLEKADKAPWFDGDVSELGLLLGSEVTTIVPAEGGVNDGN